MHKLGAKNNGAGLDFIFTDGHARNQFSEQYTADDIERIDEIIDNEAIKAKYWNSLTDLDLKRRREAEFLVLGDIPEKAIGGYCVYNQAALEQMKNFGIDASKVRIKLEYYF